jgi:hypothetical protein
MMCDLIFQTKHSMVVLGMKHDYSFKIGYTSIKKSR